MVFNFLVLLVVALRMMHMHTIIINRNRLFICIDHTLTVTNLHYIALVTINTFYSLLHSLKNALHLQLFTYLFI